MRHKKQTNILITSAGKRVALVRAFKEALAKHFPESRVFTTDMNPHMAPAGYVSDGCHAVPRCTEPNYVDSLFDLCESLDIGLVVPTIDTELLPLAASIQCFEEIGVTVATPEKEFVAICRDKRITFDFMQQHGVRVPRPIDPLAPTFPMFAKPYDGSLSTNLHIIHKAEDLTTDILADKKLLFMEYIDKRVYKEYTVDMYYGKDGRVKSIVPRERIEIRAGEINKGITAKNGIVPFLKNHFDCIRGCHGCICMQFFWREDAHDLVGIEINPRFGGGYPLTHASGADYPDLLIREYFKGEAIDYSDNWKDHLLMLRYDEAVFV